MTITQSDDRQLQNKVPEVTVDFWLIKLLAVTVGETAADYMAGDLGLGLARTGLVLSGVLAAALSAQFLRSRYVPWTYWLTVVLISIVGTLITDYLVDEAGMSLLTATVIFSAALALTFALWYTSEKTLSIHTIYTARRESFYWLAILFTFALGTAAGDLAAEEFGLGYLQAGFLFAAVIAIVAMAYTTSVLGGLMAFWLAYILTRPVGASLGDFLSQPADEGGLGFGATKASGLFLVAILALILYQTLVRRGTGPRGGGQGQ